MYRRWSWRIRALTVKDHPFALFTLTSLPRMRRSPIESLYAAYLLDMIPTIPLLRLSFFLVRRWHPRRCERGECRSGSHEAFAANTALCEAGAADGGGRR